MNNIYRNIFFTFLLLLVTYSVKSQGCSDAGACTINSFKPNYNDTLFEKNNQIRAGLSYGFADYTIMVVGGYLEYNRALGDKFGLDLKLTSLSQDGNSISSAGLSDIFLNTNYKITPSTFVSLGFKIPLSDGNKKQDSLSLPMDYQSSLGTFDLLLGFGVNIKNFQILFGAQQPLTQNNNEFLAEEYPDSSALRAFQSTNKYIRSGDILLRLSYVFKIGDSFKITPSILSIYHLANDKYTDIDNFQRTIFGSQGLTINGNLYFDYEINEKNALQFSWGAPFLVRDARPDGLTRKYVLNLEYRFRF